MMSRGDNINMSVADLGWTELDLWWGVRGAVLGTILIYIVRCCKLHEKTLITCTKK